MLVHKFSQNSTSSILSPSSQAGASRLEYIVIPDLSLLQGPLESREHSAHQICDAVLPLLLRTPGKQICQTYDLIVHLAVLRVFNCDGIACALRCGQALLPVQHRFHLQQHFTALFGRTFLPWRRRWARNPRRDSEICRQPFRCLFDRQAEQPCGKVNHISIGSAAEAVEALVQFHAGVVILVERTAGHPIPIHSQSIVFCRLAGCDEALDSFEVYKYGASLLFRFPATGKALKPSAEVRWYARYGRFQVAAFFRVPCFRFCKSIRPGSKTLQEIDKIAILQLTLEEKLQICNLTSCQSKSDTIFPGADVNYCGKWYQLTLQCYGVVSKALGNAVTVASFPAVFDTRSVQKI